MATVKTEAWVKEVIKRIGYGEDALAWLAGLPDFSRYAKNNIINLLECGVDPDVLFNNTTYPIPTQTFDDTKVPISLDKYQTKGTVISDDELYAIAIDKIRITKDRHADKIAETKHNKAAHALAPASNAALTPVLVSTGENDGTGRKRCTPADVIKLRTALSKTKIKGLFRLVLCPDHIGDLLTLDQNFKAQYYNYQTGKIGNMYGFEVHEYVENPYFTVDGVKVAFGTTPAGTDTMASTVFNVPRMFKAVGDTKMYYKEAAKNPETQANVINFRHYFITLPQKQEGLGAIYSGDAS